MYPAAVSQEKADLLLRHSDTVVFHRKDHVFTIESACYPDLPAVIHAAHSIIDGVLKNRLKDQLHGTVGIYFLIHVKLNRKCILITHLLYIHIALRMLQFVSHRDHCIPF